MGTDYHISEAPMLEQDDHFKRLSDNPTYIHPADWRRTDELIDWLVQQLDEIKAFMRMGGNASDLKTFGWNGDGSGNGTTECSNTLPDLARTQLAESSESY